MAVVSSFCRYYIGIRGYAVTVVEANTAPVLTGQRRWRRDLAERVIPVLVRVFIDPYADVAVRWIHLDYVARAVVIPGLEVQVAAVHARGWGPDCRLRTPEATRSVDELQAGVGIDWIMR